MNLLRWFVEGVKARKRGEVRVAPLKATGRVFAKKGLSGAGAHAAQAKAVGVLTARVYRAATGEWENITLEDRKYG